MGMMALCSGGCGYKAPSDSHRGGRLGNCPQCGAPMRGHTAGRAKGRYVCPISGSLVTLGLGGVQLARAMRIAVENPDDPQRNLGPWEWDYLARANGLVFGPGCVVTGDVDPGRPNPRGWTRTILVPVPDADPATWFVNERLVYKKCRGCGAQVIANDDANLMATEWVPKRTRYTGNGWTGTRPVDMGPHKAGTYGCRACREGEQW